MSDTKLRQAIALEAARLMYERTESEYYTAKRKAAKRLCRHSLKPEDLPSNAEIREQIQLFARLHEGERRTENLRAMRLEALRMMRLLRAFRPRLIGSVMTGKAIERASLRELEELLAREYPGLDLEGELHAAEGATDPYPVFRLLLLPLENVKGHAAYHPEGDVLYHSLQVFEQARERRPYDE